MTKRFEPSKKKYSLRPEAALLTYSLAEHKEKPFLIDPYDKVGPGLYPDESVYTLDTGQDVAVSVKAEWNPNGSGVSLLAWGRWINEDGSTRLGPEGQEVEVSYSHGFNAEQIEKHGIQTLMREMLLLVLGEDAELEDEVEVDENAPDVELPANVNAARVKFNKTESKMKVLHAPTDVRLGASIRHGIKHVTETSGALLPVDIL